MTLKNYKKLSKFFFKYNILFKKPALNNSSCDCSYFLKYAVCAHMSAYINSSNKKCIGDKYKNKFEVFVYKAKRGRAKIQKS